MPRQIERKMCIRDSHYTEPSEGKVLLMADTRGMFRVDTALLNQVNSIGDLTISTLPDHFPPTARYNGSPRPAPSQDVYKRQT